MEHLTNRISGNLREIRKQRGLSLEQTSILTKISKSMLSQIERAEVNPTITTVYKLSQGLKVPVTAFTAEKKVPFALVEKESVKPLEGNEGKYRLYPIFSFQEGQSFEIFDLEFDVGGDMEANTQMLGTREFITVYQGEMTLVFKDRQFVLSEGMAASYNAFDNYTYKNTGNVMIKANIVVQYSG